jgi:hypothetical protein
MNSVKNYHENNIDSFMDEKIIKKRKTKNNTNEKRNSLPLTEKKVFADGRLYFGIYVYICVRVFIFMNSDIYILIYSYAVFADGRSYFGIFLHFYLYMYKWPSNYLCYISIYVC